MLNNILNLEGVTVLNKQQQKEINGGQTCRFTIKDAYGTHVIEQPGFAEDTAGSSQANDACVSLIEAGAFRCFYDCEYDGFHQ